jgi:hypothetical protein
MVLDTRGHDESISSGYWAPVDAQLRAFAADVRADLERNGPATILYFGVDEIPTLIALAAFIGDEHRIGCRDYDRDTELFKWPTTERTVQFEAVGIPKECVDIVGDVVLRIELSYPIQSGDIDAVVPSSRRLADISIRPKERTPQIGLLRSQADVESFRRELRKVLASIERFRPSTQCIQLFVSASIAAVFATGQELRLRNGRRVQTYRYRSATLPPQTAAILLTPEATDEVSAPLTDEERGRAAQVRHTWLAALAELKAHAALLRSHGEWPQYLRPVLAANACPASLASIWQLINAEDAIAPDDTTEFRFDRQPSERRWYLSDRMLLAMYAAAQADDDKVKRLARAFFWHEYLHDYQFLTEHTAAEVGGFGNCLERLDYVADAYGTLHQADFTIRNSGVVEPRDVISVLDVAITEAIDAFWTFEQRPPTKLWQIRRLRRYLNWYWRRVQIRNASTVQEAIKLLCDPPIIEIAGPSISTNSRRVFMDLSRIRAFESLELAIVDDRSRLLRFPTSPTLSIQGLLNAFIEHDLKAIDLFFAALYDHARQYSGPIGDSK